jgi:serine protease Do
MTLVTQRTSWLVAIVLIVVLLIIGGVVSIRVDVHPPQWASAEFWTNAPVDGPLHPAYQLWVDLAKGARPAVVNVSIQSRGTDPRAEFFRRFFEPGPPGGNQRSSLGSGFILSPDGYIVTNNHVVAAGGDIIVRLDRGREHPARIVGTDPPTDLALLKIEASSLPVLGLGDSDRLQVGEPVMAIGNPFGLDQTVTTGIVSAKERFIGSGPYDEFVQTDASINPGNSGGPLLDSRGAVVGINSAIFSQSGGSIGIGFAIPINLAKTVLLQLRDRGAVVRGYLGVSVRPISPDVDPGLPADQRGAVVESLVEGAPAQRAGVQKGDVIVAVNEQPILAPPELTRRIVGMPPGTKVELSLLRKGKPLKIPVELGRRPEQPAR